jgi:hypothetical protein
MSGPVKQEFRLEGISQRKLTGVKSYTNQNVFLLRLIFYFKFKGNLLFKLCKRFQWLKSKYVPNPYQ